ncbi:hypothetical protein [Micromonospora sp. NPDC049799]|uniref:hypothetical protein n=1 Tax=Micromonospora sp. NPDC049799 TaxID=3154741 RepID=UPI0033FB7CCA
MATAQKPAGQPTKSNRAAMIWIVVLTVLCCGGVVVYPSWGAVFGDGDSDRVPPPTAQERGDTVAILARTSASQGVCYGWELTDYFDYGDPLSVGSNLGEGVPVEGNPACPRWVRVSAQILYASDSSDSNDNAYVDVEGSADFSSTELLRIGAGLERLGVTEDAFIDDPGWAVTRAAVMLPLLAVEAGAVEPAATPAAAAASPPPLADPGEDLWRDRWGWLVGAAGLLLITVLFVTIGLVQRRRQRGAAATVPAQRRESTTRTPEKA